MNLDHSEASAALTKSQRMIFGINPTMLDEEESDTPAFLRRRKSTKNRSKIYGEFQNW